MFDSLDPAHTADFVDQAPTQTIDEPAAVTLNRFTPSIPSSEK